MDTKVKQYGGRNKHVPVLDADHILHAQSRIHIHWFAHAPVPLRALHNPQHLIWLVINFPNFKVVFVDGWEGGARSLYGSLVIPLFTLEGFHSACKTINA